MFNIKMAGLTIQINNRYSEMFHRCKDYWTEDENIDFSVSASEQEILNQQKRDGGGYTIPYCESLCLFRNLCMKLPDYEGFLIHGAAVERDGEAYLFLAKSGVGKSTHAALWQTAFGDQVRIINGDKPILRRFDGCWHVCGTPWQGKEDWGCNDRVPLKALCFLERGNENQMQLLTPQEVVNRIFHQLLLPNDEEGINTFFSLLEDMLEKIPSYRLRCNCQPEAAQIAWNIMKNK